MRHSFGLLIVAAVIAGFMTAAGALVPIAVLTYEDHARAQVTETAALPASPGGQLVIASYTLEPGTDSGWRDHAGPAVLAVTSGRLLLNSGTDCQTREYTTGQAAVVRPGRHRLSTVGDQAVAFSGAFLGGAPDGVAPLLEENAVAPTPSGCDGAARGGLRTVTSSPSAIRFSRGVFVGPEAYGHSAHRHHVSGIEMQAGTDILVTSYRAEPYGTAGWMTHRPAFGIITKGTLTYYQGHEGRCVKNQFTAGQAYVHASPVTHMPANDGPEAIEAIYVFFNLPHKEHPVPVAGNQTDAIDFTPLPPQDCPRLR